MTGERAAPAIVLVVEDTWLNRAALVRGVQREGHTVLEAADGREALTVLERERVDMVLLDLLMPEVDGFEVLAAMRRDPDLRDVPVLVISAVEATEDIARALELGAIDCLPKPFDPLLLRVRLRTTLEQIRLRRVEQDYLRQELALRQQERLATLGRLSAGLAHELNNPAAAALSRARQLERALAEVDGLLPRLLARRDGPALADAVAALLRARAGPATASDGMEEALESALADLGLSEPWRVAGDLAQAGVAEDALRDASARLGDGAAAVFSWISLRARIDRAAADITASVERMAELTAALRGYSFLDRAPEQEVDIRQGLDDTLAILSHKLPPGVAVRREYADVPLVAAFGSQLNQVWTNLLDNAIDAVGEEGLITVRLEADGEGVMVAIEDDGPGIPEDLQGRVFDPFVTTKPPGEGPGLGLTVAHQIVRDVHGGRLTLRSRPGSTVLEVRLPLDAGHQTRSDSGVAQ